MKVDLDKKTVVVGLDGGLQSLVAAYLLKKQGVRCKAVCVVLIDRPEYKEIFPAFNNQELESIKEVCDRLEIPFYAANAIDEFFDQVLDPFVARRLEGKLYNPGLDRALTIIKVLFRKAKLLGADYVATGHFAKIVHSTQNDSFQLVIPNDQVNDETFGLSKLPDEYLSRLIFPLSDVRSEEVHKIGRLIDSTGLDTDIAKGRKLRRDLVEKDGHSFLRTFAPKALIREGTVYGWIEETTIGEHKGIDRFRLGQDQIQLEGRPLDSDWTVLQINPAQGSVILERKDNLHYTVAFIINFRSVGKLDTSVPIRAYVRFFAREEMKECMLYFKNNNGIELVFKEEQTGICPDGVDVVFYARKDHGGRVIGRGEIHKSGNYIEGEFRRLPLNKVEKEAVGVTKKIDASKELRF